MDDKEDHVYTKLSHSRFSSLNVADFAVMILTIKLCVEGSKIV